MWIFFPNLIFHGFSTAYFNKVHLLYILLSHTCLNTRSSPFTWINKAKLKSNGAIFSIIHHLHVIKPCKSYYLGFLLKYHLAKDCVRGMQEEVVSTRFECRRYTNSGSKRFCLSNTSSVYCLFVSREVLVCFLADFAQDRCLVSRQAHSIMPF